ncbi:MAG: hypothetical protein KDD82_10740 [Planctomycetes bacterium]|nr:hypothetical protein [Planctomycetota bacterium]
MSQKTVELSPEDAGILEGLMQASPFTEKVLLRVALRIGLETIRKDPTVLMPYLSKKFD